MAKKNLNYFMRDNKEEIVTVSGPASFVDENGDVVKLEIKVLSQAEITKINEMYRHRSMATDKKGNPYIVNGVVAWKEEKDNAKATARIIVEALQYPNLRDEELMKFYNCVDATQMPMLVFSKADEYAYVTRAVMVALGIMDGELDEETVDEAKN